MPHSKCPPILTQHLKCSPSNRLWTHREAHSTHFFSFTSSSLAPFFFLFNYVVFYRRRFSLLAVKFDEGVPFNVQLLLIIRIAIVNQMWFCRCWLCLKPMLLKWLNFCIKTHWSPLQVSQSWFSVPCVLRKRVRYTVCPEFPYPGTPKFRPTADRHSPFCTRYNLLAYSGGQTVIPGLKLVVWRQ